MHYEALRSEHLRRFRHIFISCRNGHVRTYANTYTRPDGRVECRVCRAAASRRYRQRKKLLLN
jgi:hypothetical protein